MKSEHEYRKDNMIRLINIIKNKSIKILNIDHSSYIDIKKARWIDGRQLIPTYSDEECTQYTQNDILLNDLYVVMFCPVVNNKCFKIVYASFEDYHYSSDKKIIDDIIRADLIHNNQISDGVIPDDGLIISFKELYELYQSI